jgi:hypothetical protein
VRHDGREANRCNGRARSEDSRSGS